MRQFMIKGKKSGETRVLVVFFMLAVALVLVASFPGLASASGMQGHEGLVRGEVAAVSNSHDTPTITLNEANKLSPVNPNSELNIFLNNKTNLIMCKAEKPLKDIKVGDRVTVSYHELAGLAVADRISRPC